MVFDIRAFGAVGDGKTLNTAAFQKAIDECAVSGGKVLVAGGVYKTSTIFLKSNVELHIAADAVLLAPSECEDYIDLESLKHLNTEFFPRHRNACLIYCEESENVSITGMGKIDGNGTYFVKERPDPKYAWTKERINDRTPSFVVVFAGCKNVKVEDITMCNQPVAWSYWVHDCDYVSFDKCKILSSVEYPNNDGIHINSSRNVTVSNCDMYCGDDCIVVRANNITLKENKICEKVTVTNCNLTSSTNGIRIGWINDGTIRNCVFSNLNITDSKNGIGLHLPSREGDKRWNDEGREATLVENISFNNIMMDGIYGHPIRFLISDCENTLCEAVRNIDFSNIRARSLDDIFIWGRKRNPIQNINFSGCSFQKFLSQKEAGFKNEKSEQWERPDDGNNIAHVENLQMINTIFTII